MSCERMRLSTKSPALTASLALTALMALSASGCGPYRVGNQTLYRPHIRTVYVPMVEADTFRRRFGERLHEAVVKEIELKTPYKVVGCLPADAVLTVRLTNETKRVLVVAPTGDGREVQVGLFANVVWTDGEGRIIHDTENVPVSPIEVKVEETASFLPEVGQSLATAHQRAIEGVAERVVSMMENPW
ncbi:MAG: LPS assembly lipoprotein LptE [Planctomycetales bacterium]